MLPLEKVFPGTRHGAVHALCVLGDVVSVNAARPRLARGKVPHFASPHHLNTYIHAHSNTYTCLTLHCLPQVI
ncbi:hypothetical protein K470DRAFT_46639 [Piedraia hortae CBS 480.64]|uniref:Uncharacterized protein n=1 Tax=Piedraia hortae CBS 480.64 TaxID=1314780 RepID=A0A6A7C1J9_9PEZI|nr:hypothetical protein K470DRAFT_46639 [Piedraia hortae CBS 480.64]